MDPAKLHSILSTVWVVWFFLLFLGMLAYVLRPSKRQQYQRMAEIPFRDEARSDRRSI